MWSLREGSSIDSSRGDNDDEDMSAYYRMESSIVRCRSVGPPLKSC